MCSKCNIEKPSSEFHKRADRPSGLQPHCKECERKRNLERIDSLKDYSKKSYMINKDKVCIKSAKTGKEKLEKIQKIKSETPCKDCGQKFHYSQMDFDHLDDTQKSFELNQARWRKWEEIEKEINKCELVCANCHRLRTFNRKQFIKSAQKGGLMASIKAKRKSAENSALSHLLDD